MLDALIFDFDGVVVDSEPLHLKCFQKLLAGRGVELTREAYYSKY
ncbi:MAG: HAD family phosphatase, partial [Phycisphaerae bacterium]|nr:HAD family phosphatase [Phycisphaerae bacterium]